MLTKMLVAVSQKEGRRKEPGYTLSANCLYPESSVTNCIFDLDMAFLPAHLSTGLFGFWSYLLSFSVGDVYTLWGKYFIYGIAHFEAFTVAQLDPL